MSAPRPKWNRKAKARHVPQHPDHAVLSGTVRAGCDLLDHPPPSDGVGGGEAGAGQIPGLQRPGLATGDYFDDINTWFSDTFPFRDVYVSLNTQFKSFLSPTDTTVHGDVEQGDEIPTKPRTPMEEPVIEEPEEPSVDEPDHEIEEPDMTDVPWSSWGPF